MREEGTPASDGRRWVCHKPGWMGPCSPQSTHHNGFDWGCGWIYFPAPSTPGEGAGRPDTAALRYMAKVSRGRVNNRVDWERTLLDAADWIDTQPPASPADDVPDADAVAFQNGYRIGVRVGSEHHGPCRGLPPASPVPPTPTPCPYIVTGGEGTSYCSLAEQTPTPQADGGWLRRLLSMPTLCRLGQLDAELREATSERQEEEIAAAFPEAVHDLLNALDALAAAPPSTPADPRPTDPTGSEA